MNDNLQHSAGARRISWVDYGKGLAILLVFWGHAICPEPVRASFYAFHIPVFYFLSGYVFSTRKYHSFGPFLWHKVRTLIIPGLTFGFLIVFFKWLNGLIAGEAYSVNPLKLLIGVFVGMSSVLSRCSANTTRLPQDLGEAPVGEFDHRNA